jgi:hypothetical protein
VATLEVDILVVFYYLSASDIWPNKRVASPEVDNLVVFYYLSVSQIWAGRGGVLCEGVLL